MRDPEALKVIRRRGRLLNSEPGVHLQAVRGERDPATFHRDSVGVGVAPAEMSPLATAFRTLVPLPRSIVLKLAHWVADTVTVSLPLLPVCSLLVIGKSIFCLRLRLWGP